MTVSCYLSRPLEILRISEAHARHFLLSPLVMPVLAHDFGDQHAGAKLLMVQRWALCFWSAP